MAKKKETIKREVPEAKKRIVSELAKLMQNSKTTMLASTKGLPGSQFHKIKKQLRGVVELRVAKKSAVIRAIEASGVKELQNLKEKVAADSALMFSKDDPFTLSMLLKQKQSPSRAKVGEIAPEDISVEPGPTDLIPGPAISELASVGLKVAVENGKLAIKTGAKVVKKGEAVSEKAAGVLSKLGITPMKVGFLPIAAYDSSDKKVYSELNIDPEAVLSALREQFGRSLGFAVKISYPAKETISYILQKAGREEIALSKKVDVQTATKEASA